MTWSLFPKLRFSCTLESFLVSGDFAFGELGVGSVGLWVTAVVVLSGFLATSLMGLLLEEEVGGGGGGGAGTASKMASAVTLPPEKLSILANGLGRRTEWLLVNLDGVAST